MCKVLNPMITWSEYPSILSGCDLFILCMVFFASLVLLEYQHKTSKDDFAAGGEVPFQAVTVGWNRNGPTTVGRRRSNY